jgi:hypothetical protein
MVALTPPGGTVLSAVGFGSPSGGDEAGGLGSSVMSVDGAQTSGVEVREKNVNFYQLEQTVSTSVQKGYCLKQHLQTA